MLRLSFLPFVAATLAATASGCFGSVDSTGGCEVHLGSTEAELHWLENRYALGTRTMIRLTGLGPLTLESTNPDVVRVDNVGSERAALSFVGEGRATLVARNDESVDRRDVEVARHETFVLLLSELGAIPLGPLSDQVLLAGPQYFIVVYLDSEGRQLYGDELAEVELSDGLDACEDGLHRLELHCFISEQASEHTLSVRVGEEEVAATFETVPHAELIGIELLRTEEDELREGTWAQIDVVGVTENGRRVSSVHPRFLTSTQGYVGYFAYQYDPAAPPQKLDVEALQWRKRLTFHGVPSEKTAFGCKRADGGDHGPIFSAASLAGMAFFIRLGARRRRDKT